MTTLLNILLCFSSFCVFAYLLYLRFTKKIYIIELYPENINNYYYLFLYLFVMAVGFLLVILGLWVFTVKFSKEQKNYKFLLLLTFWYHRVNIFYKSYSLLFHWLNPKYTENIIKLARKFLTWTKTTKIMLICVFGVLPRVMILLVLLYEIHAKLLHYYFYSLLLLFIPLFFKFFVFILKDVGPRLLPKFREFLIFDSSLEHIDVNIGNNVKRLKPIGIKFKPENQDLNLDFFLYTYYYPMLYIEPEMAINFLPKYSKIITLTLIFYYLFHGVAWCYILVFLS